MKATLIIPVKDEPYLSTLLSQLDGYEVLVQREPGLSNAVLCGVARAHGDRLVVCDGDGSHPASAIPAMLQLLDAYDVVVGSRYVYGGKSLDSFGRRILSRFFNGLARGILRISVRDNMSGFVAVRREVFEQLDLHPWGYKWGLEVIYKSKGRFKVTEYPIRFEKRKKGKSKTRLREGLRTFAFIFKLRLESIK